FGTLLDCSIEKTEELLAFRSTPHGCPFWGFDHLCTMQKKHGTDYMPAVCIQFPRQLYNLEFFCEETLYLACPESARLFLVSVYEDKSFDFTVSEGSVNYEVNTTNDDREFLDYLLKSRDELVSMLKNGTRFDSMAIIEYGRDAQNACLAQSPLPNPLDYASEEQYQISFKRMNTLFFNGFYHPSLRTISPFLYRLCKKYIHKFGPLRHTNPTAGNKKLAALKKSLYQKMPDLDNLLNRYYEYHLYTDFLDTFEDYSFSKHLLYGIVKAHMLWLFLALYAENRKLLSTDEIAKIIAVYERRAPQIEDALKKL
ncbi:MAG: hypothetical protein K2H91_00685, partial [Lachnospiraceae bacterium]|nr:hypothetical protein [Lachnospiraceae bacterium]